MTTVQLSPDYNFIVPTTAPTHTRLGKTKATILQDSSMDRLLTKSWKAMTLQDSGLNRLLTKSWKAMTLQDSSIDRLHF